MSLMLFIQLSLCIDRLLTLSMDHKLNGGEQCFLGHIKICSFLNRDIVYVYDLEGLPVVLFFFFKLGPLCSIQLFWDLIMKASINLVFSYSLENELVRPISIISGPWTLCLMNSSWFLIPQTTVCALKTLFLPYST